jgi:hypothetical protein
MKFLFNKKYQNQYKLVQIINQVNLSHPTIKVARL